MRNRCSHIGISKLRQYRPIGIRDHRMNHTLRMNHDINLVWRGAKQPMRLNDFQSLVHHRSGVDRYFSTHTPIRMRYGLLGSDLIQCADIAIQKWAARGC